MIVWEAIFLEKITTKNLLFFLEKRTTKTTPNPTGWGAGQPGFPCKCTPL
jgi:hypothetical protein